MSLPPAWRCAVLAILPGGLLASAAIRAASITVSDGDDLQAKIDGAAGGDVLLLGTGTYRGFRIDKRHFTEAAPLVLKAAPGATPRLLGSDHAGYLGRISDSSYLVLDGLTFENSNQPVYCTDVDHLILLNLVVHDTGQEMVHIRGTSRHVDIRRCRLYDSGHTEPQWAEGIYIGRGQPPFDNVDYVWIEGNEIHHTGNSEGINIKSRSYHITIRGNDVHDIAPGTATQYNESAISCEAADLAFRPGVDPDIWIEDNEVHQVRYGRWANGIQPTTMGARIIRNRIHDCAQYGIEFNDYLNGPGAFTIWLFGNVIERCAAGAVNATTLSIKTADPGANPNQPQTWYRPTDEPPATAH
ncbi:MAG TPA: right-handed parallel beta-helix repeat-containing protein [Opitutaceae bacterium]|nr:right-handed parallel beta-helix repeat-containing protein [Opitutaceae bacterium]